MNEDIIHIKSISQLHEMKGDKPPSHPLITVIDSATWVIEKEMIGVKVITDFYSIALKDKGCGIDYGRKPYDFNEGVLIFSAPKQLMSPNKEQKLNEVQGWMLFFHPDLIRNTVLGLKIDEYNFFSYDVYEALHLSDNEQEIVTNCANLIKHEINERIDNHSQTVISSTLELMLNYSNRFYERQFNTRSAQNSDVILKFNKILKDYYKEGKFLNLGIPSVGYFADRVNLSANYLSDLMKRETAYGAKDHINNFIIEKAKTLLLSNTDSIGELAYSLGFNYPHYFSRLFKSKTGLSPQEYRQLN